MTPLKFLSAIWFFCCIAGQAFATQDSLSLAQQQTIAYKLFLANPDSAISLSLRSLGEAERLDDRYLQAYCYYVLSKAYWTKANFRLSSEYGFKALRLLQDTNHIDLLGKTLLSLARTFIDLKNYPQGEAYLQKAEALAKLNQKTLLLAECFREKSMLLSETASYDSALFYAEKGITVFKQLDDSINVSILLSRKAKIFFNQKNHEESKHYNKLALEYDRRLQNPRALSISYYQSALDALYANDLKTALTYLNESKKIGSTIENTAILVKVHEQIASIYQTQNELDHSLQHLKLALQYKDSLYNTEKNGQIQEMQSLYDLSAKEHQIRMLESENLIRQHQVKLQWLFVTFLLLCMVLLGLTIYSSKRYHKFQRKVNAELAEKNRSIEQQKEEIKAQAENLLQISELKSKLFSVISHDLRGPLASLYSFLDLLLGSNLSQEEFIMISQKLKSNFDVTQRTLDNLLNWSLSQMEGLRTEPVSVNIHKSVREAALLLSEAARGKNVDLVISIDETLYIRTDEDQLQLILRNLLHNAIKFSKQNKQVTISATYTDDQCYLSVKDAGIGMSEKEIETVMSGRNHLSKIGTMQEKGTGLGLLLCHEFVKRNDGQLEIRSKTNHGTEVIISIPRVHSDVITAY